MFARLRHCIAVRHDGNPKDINLIADDEAASRQLHTSLENYPVHGFLQASNRRVLPTVM